MIRSFTEPLEYIPVRHTCGHFELRLTRWSTHEPEAQERGYLSAGNPCTLCNPQGRSLEPAYGSLENAQYMKPILDAHRRARLPEALR